MTLLLAFSPTEDIEGRVRHEVRKSSLRGVLTTQVREVVHRWRHCVQKVMYTHAKDSRLGEILRSKGPIEAGHLIILEEPLLSSSRLSSLARPLRNLFRATCKVNDAFSPSTARPSRSNRCIA